MNCNNLIGVKRVEFVEQNATIDISTIGIPGEYPLSVNGFFKNIELADIGKLVIESKSSGNQAITTSKLSFVCLDFPLKTEAAYYFKVYMVSGECRLLGYPGMPAPSISEKYQISDRPSNPRAYTINIEWNSDFKPILVKI